VVSAAWLVSSLVSSFSWCEFVVCPSRLGSILLGSLLAGSSESACSSEASGFAGSSA